MSQGYRKQLRLAASSCQSLVILKTVEERRAIRETIEELGRRYQYIQWDAAEGITIPECSSEQVRQIFDRLGHTGSNEPTKADRIKVAQQKRSPVNSQKLIADALHQVDKTTKDEKVCLFLPDYHKVWKSVEAQRGLKNLVFSIDNKSHIIIAISSENVPIELRDISTTIRMPPPAQSSIEKMLIKIVKDNKEHINTKSYHKIMAGNNKLSDEIKEEFIPGLKGLTQNGIRRVVREQFAAHRAVDPKYIKEVLDAKQEQLAHADGALQYFPPDCIEKDAVGGLDILKKFLYRRKKAYSSKAREYGLSAPKGVALVGIPGTGKSLSAKMVANLFNQPLIRIDIGSLFGSLVGESEERTRNALSLVESVAPCVLWIDELEKALSTGSGDNGTSKRVFGTILTWMQEKQADVFVIATANNVDNIPPELLRKGRFDEVFFLNLPTPVEREEIFDIHLRKRGRDIANFDKDLIINQLDGFVGAEIESVIEDAMYIAFEEDREVETKDILQAISSTTPLKEREVHKIRDLLEWQKKGGAVVASTQPKQNTKFDKSEKINMDTKSEKVPIDFTDSVI